MVSPLAGVRVVEVTSWMAAPSAGAVLADMGADVVKVEPLTGDVVRGMMRRPKLPDGTVDIDLSFQVDNRGKRSIAVALDRPEGAELVRRLVDRADVFLCNLLPHRQHRYALDAETLLARRPQLVHAALRLVDRTGGGQVVDVSLLATAAWTMASDLAPTLVDGRSPSKRDRHHLIAPLANRFRCGDDRWIILNMPEVRWWAPFCEAIDRPELLEDPRFGTVRERLDNMPELIALLDEAFASRSLAEWGRTFDEAGLIWGPAATIAELAADPQAAAIELFPTVEHPDGPFRTVAAPMRIAGADIRPRGPAPAVGAHSAEVLHELGLDADEIAALAAAGVIGGV